jgi:hypothetical protein
MGINIITIMGVSGEVTGLPAGLGVNTPSEGGRLSLAVIGTEDRLALFQEFPQLAGTVV